MVRARIPMAAALALLATGCQADNLGGHMTGPLPRVVEGEIVSSHDVGFFRDLNIGRVAVFEGVPPGGGNPFGTFGTGFVALYAAPAETGHWSGRSCTVHANGRGTMSTTDKSFPIYSDPVWRTRNYQVPVQYDPASGQWATYWRDRTAPDLRYVMSNSGWRQNSWPAVARRLCPDLPLPPDLPVNKRQTSTDFATLYRQDPAAPIRNFRTNTPVSSVPMREYLARLPDHDGEVFVCADAGHRCAVFLEHSEIYQIAVDGSWRNSGTFEVDEAAGVYRHRWRYGGEVWEAPLTGWMPVFRPTGKPHPIKVLLDRITPPDAAAVPLPDGAGGEVTVKFQPDLTAVVANAAGNTRTGRWALKEGYLELHTPEGEMLTRWPTRGFDRYLYRAGILP